MGGKQWSAIEEAFFWTEIVSHSGKRVASDRANAEKTWNELAAVMQEKMGNNALRTYTGNSLLEHWYKNVQERRFSRHAHHHVLKYLEQMPDDDLGPKREGQNIGADKAAKEQGNEDKHPAEHLPKKGAGTHSDPTTSSSFAKSPVPAFSSGSSALSPAAGAEYGSHAFQGHVLPPITEAVRRPHEFQQRALPPIRRANGRTDTFQQPTGEDRGGPGLVSRGLYRPSPAGLPSPTLPSRHGYGNPCNSHGDGPTQGNGYGNPYEARSHDNTYSHGHGYSNADSHRYRYPLPGPPPSFRPYGFDHMNRGHMPEQPRNPRGISNNEFHRIIESEVDKAVARAIGRLERMSGPAYGYWNYAVPVSSATTPLSLLTLPVGCQREVGMGNVAMEQPAVDPGLRSQGLTRAAPPSETTVSSTTPDRQLAAHGPSTQLPPAGGDDQKSVAAAAEALLQARRGGLVANQPPLPDNDGAVADSDKAPGVIGDSNSGGSTSEEMDCDHGVEIGE